MPIGRFPQYRSTHTLSSLKFLCRFDFGIVCVWSSVHVDRLDVDLGFGFEAKIDFR